MAGSLKMFVLSATICACLCAATFSAARAPALAQTREPEPGEGVACMWAIYSAMAELGRRCHAGENVELQAELERTVARIDTYVLENAPGVTSDQIANFKREQSNSDSPDELLCRPGGDANQFYADLVQSGPAQIRQDIDALLARPGEPTWGTCF